MSTVSEEAFRQCIEGMQAQLSPVLSFDDGPVVVPVWQQVGRQSSDGFNA
jgi:hypothetical protein